MNPRIALPMITAFLLAAQGWSAEPSSTPGANPAPSTIPDCRELLTWRQDQNDFYSNQIPSDVFDQIAAQKGLDTLEDLRQPPIQALLGSEEFRVRTKPPRSVLEIGPGYGRIYGALTAMESLPQVTCIEVGDAQIRHLRQKFEQRDRTKLYEGNVGEPDALLGGIHADLALWLFAGILELSPDEKKHAVGNLHRAMAKGGWLVVDLPLHPVKTSLHMRNLERKGVLLLSKAPYQSDPSRNNVPDTFRLHPITTDARGQYVVDFSEIVTVLTGGGLFRQADVEFWVPAGEAEKEPTVRKTNRWEYDPKGDSGLRRVLYFFRKN